jgi:selenocysteine lyase/cysteine desulfurase
MQTTERSGILSFRLRGERTAACFEHLAASRIQCSFREGLIRFSPHLYNTVEDIDRIVGAVRKFLG